MKRYLITGLLSLWALAAHGADVLNLRMWPAPDKTRVVFDVTGPVEYNVFQMQNPERVVIDFPATRVRDKLVLPVRDENIVAGVRYARRRDQDLRVVLDLHKPVTVRKILLPPRQKYGHRFVIDLIDAEPGQAPARARPAPRRERDRDLIIAIDAGHGGEDVGAIGPSGIYEKDIVLAVARELAKEINAMRGFRAVMVRDGDYYVGLRKRMQRARDQEADLFISIHADAFRDPSVKGSSVYVLSRKGASSEAARWLAAQENAADLVGGVTLDDKDKVLQSVLLDLSQTASLRSSQEAARVVLAQLKKVGRVHRSEVQHAGFAVLKSPDVPSLLVETAFISNPGEERKLRDVKFRRRLAAAIAEGVHLYFSENAPPGTLLAQRRNHRVASGETLSSIAARYEVSTQRLKLANNKSGDLVRAGEVLRIP